MIPNRLYHAELGHGRQLPPSITHHRALKMLFRFDERTGRMWDEKRRVSKTAVIITGGSWRSSPVGPSFNYLTNDVTDTDFRRLAIWPAGTVVLLTRANSAVGNLINETGALDSVRMTRAVEEYSFSKVSSASATVALSYTMVGGQGWRLIAFDWGSRGMRIVVGGRIVKSNATTTDADLNATDVLLCRAQSDEVALLAYFDNQLSTPDHVALAAALSRGANYG